MRVRLMLGVLSNKHFDHSLVPLRTPHAEYLPRYAAKLDALELAKTYHYQRLPEEVLGWLEQAPEQFRFTPKLWRGACNPQDHLQQDVPWDDAALDAARTSLDAMQPIRDAGKLGPIVVQMPPRFKHEPAHLDWLDELLDLERPGSFVVQLADASWHTGDVEEFLRSRKTQVVWSTPEKDAPPAWVTGPVGYVRLTGKHYPDTSTRNRPVHRADRLDALLDLRDRLAAAPWKECFVACLNPFEGNAIDSLPRVAAALVTKELGHRLSRRPGETLLKDAVDGKRQAGLYGF